jgi:hypothetical protein
MRRGILIASLAVAALVSAPTASAGVGGGVVTGTRSFAREHVRDHKTLYGTLALGGTRHVGTFTMHGTYDDGTDDSVDYALKKGTRRLATCTRRLGSDVHHCRGTADGRRFSATIQTGTINVRQETNSIGNAGYTQYIGAFVQTR